MNYQGKVFHYLVVDGTLDHTKICRYMEYEENFYVWNSWIRG